MKSLIDVVVPDIGDFKDVEVIEVLVKPGDTVKPEQSLITVESDKASMEIPSSAGGVVKELKVKLGDKVSQGSAILVLEARQPAQRRPRPSARPPRPPKVATRPQRRARARRQRPRRRARPTSIATCSCSAPGPAATRLRSVRRTWARRWCWSSAMRRSAACA